MVKIHTQNSEDDGCSNVENINGAIEFIIPFDRVSVVGLIDFPTTKQRIIEEVNGINYNSDDFIGIHETESDNTKDILENGFSEKKIGAMSVRQTGVRSNAVFAWQYIQNIGYNIDELSGIIVKSEASYVTVSDMSASVMFPFDVYVEDYTIDYIDYIQCIKQTKYRSSIAGLEVGTDDLIQENLP